MTTPSKSATSSFAAGHTKHIKWFIRLGNVVIILVGILCACSLAATHHHWNIALPALQVSVQRTGDAGDVASVCRIAVLERAAEE